MFLWHFSLLGIKRPTKFHFESNFGKRPINLCDIYPGKLRKLILEFFARIFNCVPYLRFTIRSNWKSWRIHLGVFLFVFQLYFVLQLVNLNFGLVEFSTVRLSSSARRARFWKGSRKRYFLSKIIFSSLFCGMFNFVVFWIVFQAWFCQNGE